MALARVTGHTAERAWRTIIMVASYGCVAGFAVLLMLLWRKLARVPLRGLGLASSRRLWLLIPGFAFAIGVNCAVAGIAVTVGAAQWSSEQTVLPAYPTLLSIVVIFFGQAFPGELLWRGHLARLLRLRMGTRGIIITTSLGCGVLHILSGSNAQNFGDRLIYVVQAIALGCLLIAMWLGASSLWLAVGFHTGYNVFFDVVAPMPGSARLPSLADRNNVSHKPQEEPPSDNFGGWKSRLVLNVSILVRCWRAGPDRGGGFPRWTPGVWRAELLARR